MNVKTLTHSQQQPQAPKAQKKGQSVTRFYRCLGYVLVVLNLSVPKIIIS